MAREVRLSTTMASILIATLTGGWNPIAGAWQSAPTEPLIDSNASDDSAYNFEMKVDSNIFPIVQLPSVLSAARQASWNSVASRWEPQSPHDSFVRLASAEMPTLELEPSIEIDDWSDGGLPSSNDESHNPAPGARPLPTFAPEAEALLLPPKPIDGGSLDLLESPNDHHDYTPLPTLVREFPLTDFEIPNRSFLASRLGWWSVDHSGNPSKVGEYESLKPSLFFEIDGLITDGLQSLDFYGAALDNDSTNAGARYFGPSLSAKWDYQRFLHRLDRDPLNEYVDFDQQPPLPLPSPPANFRDMKEDMAVGEDYAIRVQQLNANFKGPLPNNLNWRLNVWGMRKHGERQATAMAHCFTAPNATDTNGNPVTGAACHVVSQRQRIDWQTTEIEPVLEGRFGPVSAEYSRTMRVLTTDDQFVTRPYDTAFFGLIGQQPYNAVPENLTQIDRLKFGVSLPERRDAYARLYNGNTRNYFRESNRRFHGIDLRVTDRSVDGVTVSGYAKTYVQTGQLPSFVLPSENPAIFRLPINYDRTTAGVETTWRPFHAESSMRRYLRLGCGYEYRELKRENALFSGDSLAVDQASTNTNKLHLRAGMRWSPTWNSYVRYRTTFIDNPLFAIADNDTTNTSLPTQTHRFEFSNTWSPTHAFLLTGLVGFDNRWNSSDVANFQSDDYDVVVTARYAPTPKWSVSGGLAFYSNWIDQDITLGPSSNPWTLPWEYGGRSEVINLGTTYAWTKNLTLSGTLDFVNGKNSFDPLAPWPDLPFYSDVEVSTTRFMAGIDYDLGNRSSCYVRYQVFNFDDESPFHDNGVPTQIARGVLQPGHDNGKSQMLLVGGTILY